MFFVVYIVFFVSVILCQDTEEPTSAPTYLPPVPKPNWPSTFHAWVVVSIVDSELNQSIVLNKGQNIVYDTENQYTCRYLQQNLSDRGNMIRATDFCDYDQGFHYQIQDDMDPDTPCSLRKALKLQERMFLLIFEDPSKMNPFSWPEAFLNPDDIQFMGTDKVADWFCNHWINRNFDLDGQEIQMDIWTRNDTTEYPCQISAHAADTTLFVNWAFVAFSPVVPLTARRCTAARVICDEKGYECEPIFGLNNTDDYGMALHYACEFPDQFDCAPINPGGKYYDPNDLMSHCTWAFNAYFQKFKMLYGEDACPPTVAQLIHRNKTSNTNDENSHETEKELRNRKKYGGSKTSNSNENNNEKKRMNPLTSFLKESLGPINGVPNDFVCLDQ